MIFMETEVKETQATETPAENVSMKKKADRMRKFYRTTKVNKKVMIAVVALAVILGGLYSLRGFFVAATINGSPISRWEVIRELEKKSGEQALDTLVTKKLIDMAALKAGAVVTEEDIDKEIAVITEQISKQGGTLALALEQQGMTEADLREQIGLQKKLEKILAERIAVTDEDIDQYRAQNKSVAPKDMSEEDFRNQIREQLKGQKFNAEASAWVSEIKADADINYFVDYAPKPVLSEPAGAISSQPQQ